MHLCDAECRLPLPPAPPPAETWLEKPQFFGGEARTASAHSRSKEQESVGVGRTAPTLPSAGCQPRPPLLKHLPPPRTTFSQPDAPPASFLARKAARKRRFFGGEAHTASANPRIPRTRFRWCGPRGPHPAQRGAPAPPPSVLQLPRRAALFPPSRLFLSPTQG
ncbi:hypothetical protein OF83DRAFT_1179717 [Amylostereum chailletii]|nr:hypothetical protein OF83DRAFT_1179717 [Amylostereum chailletii]